MNPNDMILASDYASLKNDTQGNTIAVTIPNNMTFNNSSPILGTATVEAGTAGANLRARGQSSKYPGWMNGLTIYSDIAMTIPSLPELGTLSTGLYCTLERISATSMRLTVAIEGSSGAPDSETAESQTITFVFSTFLSPFN